MRAMLLAAGLGTRLRPITNTLAKPAVPFLGVPLMFWSLEFLKELNPDRVVANLHYLPDSIRALAPAIQKNGLDIRFTQEVEKPLGSGGALWFAKKELQDSEHILIANADEVMFPVNPQTLLRLRDHHEKTHAIGTLLTMRHPDVGTHFGGVWTGDDHKVMGFGKDRTAFPEATQGLHYVGVLLLSRRIFEFLPDGESNLLYDALVKSIAKGERVNAFCEELHWFETGNPKDLLSASSAVLDFLSPKHSASLATDLAQNVMRNYGPSDVRLWESNTGARLLSSNFAPGSMRESQLCEALEKEKAFAVIGSNALIQSSVLNSVIFSNARVSKETRETIVVA